ncbi:Cell division protein DivIC [Lentibacillus sp. JNUCC-1]|uniref:FtsB family cell division protein n=1 Tax=Lentibacillus sp. JNUCC-1 TaxID=2654513 RepID=UPI0012E7F4A4|nr:septum formation initiator family protein [Lentibacillus sp. JNUCC-1]MUV38033.1 Cell division protein DivIC [Lentibacillus sp. JNUCC-1]
MSAKRTVTKLESSYMKQYDAHVERQNRKRQRLIRRLVLFAVIMLLIVGGMTAYHVKQRSIQSAKQAEYEQMTEKLEKLKSAEVDLREEIKLLNDDEYVLEIARTNYFFSKKGELIFKLPNEEPSY